MDVNQAITKIDKFASPDQVERARFLTADALVLYGKIADPHNKIPEFYKEIRAVHNESAIPLLIRVLDKAGVEKEYVDNLRSLAPAIEIPDQPNLYFNELLITVSDNMTKDDLRKLKNHLTVPGQRNLLGCSSNSITNAVHLFQQLLHEQTLSFEKSDESLVHLSGWLTEIGRVDIASKVEKARQVLGQRPDQGGIGDRRNPGVGTPIQETHVH